MLKCLIVSIKNYINTGHWVWHMCVITVSEVQGIWVRERFFHRVSGANAPFVTAYKITEKCLYCGHVARTIEFSKRAIRK